MMERFEKIAKNLIPPTFNFTLLLMKRDLEKSYKSLISCLRRTLQSQKGQEGVVPYLEDLDKQLILFLVTSVTFKQGQVYFIFSDK